MVLKLLRPENRRLEQSGIKKRPDGRFIEENVLKGSSVAIKGILLDWSRSIVGVYSLSAPPYGRVG